MEIRPANNDQRSIVSNCPVVHDEPRLEERQIDRAPRAGRDVHGTQSYSTRAPGRIRSCRPVGRRRRTHEGATRYRHAASSGARLPGPAVRRRSVVRADPAADRRALRCGGQPALAPPRFALPLPRGSRKVSVAAVSSTSTVVSARQGTSAAPTQRGARRRTCPPAPIVSAITAPRRNSESNRRTRPSVRSFTRIRPSLSVRLHPGANPTRSLERAMMGPSSRIGIGFCVCPPAVRHNRRRRPPETNFALIRPS